MNAAGYQYTSRFRYDTDHSPTPSCLPLLYDTDVQRHSLLRGDAPSDLRIGGLLDVRRGEVTLIPDELLSPTVDRVRWLINATPEQAAEVCAGARVDDPLAVHCARLVLHLERGVPLPDGYAWELLQDLDIREQSLNFFSPWGHLRRMAFCAVDLDAVGADIVEFCGTYDICLERLVTIRFAAARKALANERVLALSNDEDERVRALVARLLEYRDHPDREVILRRLMDDSVRRVSWAASHTAAHVGDDALRDAVAEKEDFFSLSFLGDPRARARVEGLVASDNPLDGEEAIATAFALGDRALIAKLWTKDDWDTRRDSICISRSRGFLAADEFNELLARETDEHIADVVARYYSVLPSPPLPLCERLCRAGGPLPDYDALAAGDAAAVARVRELMETQPTFGRAAIRLLPRAAAVQLVYELVQSGNAAARAGVVHLVRQDELSECYALVTELCVDADDDVVDEASREIGWAKIRCGIYGLDTAMLQERGGVVNSGLHHAACDLLHHIIVGTN